MYFWISAFDHRAIVVPKMHIVQWYFTFIQSIRKSSFSHQTLLPVDFVLKDPDFHLLRGVFEVQGSLWPQSSNFEEVVHLRYVQKLVWLCCTMQNIVFPVTSFLEACFICQISWAISGWLAWNPLHGTIRAIMWRNLKLFFWHIYEKVVVYWVGSVIGWGGYKSSWKN